MKNKMLILIIIIVLFLIGILCMNFIKQENKTDMSGKWIADGSQSKLVLSIDSDGNEVYAADYTNPYELTIKNDGTYKIVFNNEYGEEEGKYSINKESKIIIFHPNNNQTWHCEIKDEKEIVKCLYAESFVKEVNKR